jgi:Chaperone of endosialidase
MQLRPVTFHYQAAYDDGSRLLQYGLIAEELAKVYADLVQYDKAGQPQAVRYHFVNAMLLNEVQKQHAKIDKHRDRLDNARGSRGPGDRHLRDRSRDDWTPAPSRPQWCSCARGSHDAD